MVLAGWMVVRDTFEFEHNYNDVDVCHRCHATNAVGTALDYSLFGSASPLRWNADYQASIGFNVPLAQIPGWSIFICMPDPMHTGPLGIFLRRLLPEQRRFGK